MIKIGILGDIGSGKSYVARQFGYPVFHADKEVKKIYKKNKKCFVRLKKTFPNYIFSFPIKKKELSKAILGNLNNLNKINKIVHPIVRISLKKFIIKNKNKKFIVLDIPLLIENKLHRKEYILIYVQAPKKEITKRLKLRKNYNPSILKKLSKFQINLERKKKMSHYVIKNNFKEDNIKKSVNLIRNKILK